MIDPRLRQRVEVVPVRPTVRRDTSNPELLDSFLRTKRASEDTLTNYASALRDTINYMRHPDGREIPAREWTKDGVWAYLHFVEANYCASFRPAPYRPENAMCRQKVWVGEVPAAEAAQGFCKSCESFRRPYIGHRVNALSSFFRFLARIGAVPFNFMVDVSAEYWEENPPRVDEELRRNPTQEEMIRLVNGTADPMRRAFYAASAKWFFRPNEMLALDRYASLGVPAPEGVPTPPGFEDAFRKYPEEQGFHEGGDLVYIPKKKDRSGSDRPDKRKGNRWMVIDAELRPILEQYLAHWERKVQRDRHGRPAHSKLWITSTGAPLTRKMMHATLFEADCLRLGLMVEGDKQDPLRSWVPYCQRHFGEKIMELADVAPDWCNHFRGDKSKDSRGYYYKPKPPEVRRKYHQYIPILGFSPLPEAPRMQGGPVSEADVHRATLREERSRALECAASGIQTVAVEIRTAEDVYVVPRRVAPAFVFALRVRSPTTTVAVSRVPKRHPGVYFNKADLAHLCDTALALLGE